MNNYIEIMLKEAKKSLKSKDVPVSAIIVENSKIIAKAHNTREKETKITGHAEINAIEKACKKKKTWHLSNCELYTTLEPCPMCLEAIKQARIKKIYYITERTKKNNYKDIKIVKIENIEKYSEELRKFFKNKRKRSKTMDLFTNKFIR